MNKTLSLSVLFALLLASVASAQLKPDDRLPQRRAADAELARQVLLDDPAAGLGSPGQNEVLENSG